MTASTPALRSVPRRWLLASVAVAAGLCAALVSVAPAPARASAIVDPFLERFRVGWYQDPGKIAMADGWPADLFTPCRVDSVWRDAAEAYFKAAKSRPDTLTLWRFLEPALGSDEAAEAWESLHQAHWDVLVGSVGGSPDPAATSGQWLSKELLYREAIFNYQINNYSLSRLMISQLLQRRSELGLASDEVFVWSLRLRRLDALPGSVAAADTVVWPEMFVLTPGDAASAWAIWVSHRRADHAALLPRGGSTLELARWLARLRRSWLAESDLAAARFPDAVAAGLGAVALPPGPELERHFARWRSPPAEPRWQELWLRGRLRAAGWEPDAIERWAARHDLVAGNRVRLLRRASEERLVRNQWVSGLSDIRKGFVIAGARSGGAAMRRELSDWASQAIVLAVANGRPHDAKSVVALVRAHLQPSERRAWEASLPGARRPLAGLPAAQNPDTSVVARASAAVRNGIAAPVTIAAEGGFTVCVARDETALWIAWARWGLALAARDARLAAQGTREGDYQAALAAVLRAQDPAARRELACAAVAGYLRGLPERDAVLDWLLDRDIARLARGAWAVPTALPCCRGRSGSGWAARHALLGACLAAGDLGGQVLVARDLPPAGLAEGDRLRLLYPVPGPGPLLNALARSRVEEALLLALARNESLFDLAARSGAGALGMLQIMPFHYRDRGLENGRPRWRSPELTVQVGSGLLAEAARAYKGDPYRTLAAYNAGAEAVARWNRQLKGRGDRDLFLGWIGYAETRGYVEKVLIDRQIYSWILTGGQSGAP